MNRLDRFSRWLVIVAVLLFSGCATNTITGRSQLMLVSEDTAIKGSVSAYSNMMGEFSKKAQVETGTPRVERVREITNRLVAEAVRFRPDSSGWHWEVQVINDPKVVNAFCMAGGKMGIYTGFWDKFKASDDEIANVMGHEIGHALASHTREKMSMAMTVSVGATLLAVALTARNSNDPNAFPVAQNTAALAAALAITLPNSRDAETEADQIGIELAARAGFDPRAAVTLWEKMAREGDTPPEFFSTHPAPENRALRLQALVNQVDPLYQRAKENKAAGRPIPDFLGQPTNEYVVGSTTREEYTARVAAEPEVMTFVAAEFERFRKGEALLVCGYECALGYSFQRGNWKTLHDKNQWRELALSVMKVGYLGDLSYFLLGEAALGLGFRDAAKIYYARALEARKADKTCEGAFNTCEGFEIVQQIGRVSAAPAPAADLDKNINKIK